MKKLIKQARKLNPPIPEVYSKEGNSIEEAEGKKAMKNFVTDESGAIYATTPLVPELFTALLKARYSRTDLTAKQLLWREFVSKKTGIDWAKIKKGLGELEEAFNFKKAEGVAERILLQYGDDSVFELGGAHLFLDRISMIGAKVVEDARIGLSPLEKSTRYVVYDQKDANGDYLFFKDPKLMDSKHKNLFLKTTRDAFELYIKSVKILLDYFKKQVPLESQEFPDLSKKGKLTPYKNLKDEKSIKAAHVAYNASIRAKACDVARVALPASTLTNMGDFGNARAYGYLFTKMSAMNLAEMQMISHEGVREIKKILPKFLDVVDNPHGKAYQKYLKQTENILKKRAQKVLAGLKPEKMDRVELVKLDPNPEINIAAALLYPYSNLPLKQILRVVQEGGLKLAGAILHDSLKFRTNRRHKPPRAFEIAGYELVYDILGNFGIFRDLHRQRILTQQHQLYTTDHGFDMPVEFEAVGLDKELIALMGDVKKTHDKIFSDLPEESQYVTTLGNYTRWYMGMNLREAFWFTELRSVPQGHFSYRTVAQDMFIKAAEVYPFLKDIKHNQGEFVDMTDRSQNLERMEAMQRIQVKLNQIEEKYS